MAVEVNDLAQGALRRFAHCRWIGHNLAVERRTLYHRAIATPAKCSSAVPRCQVMLWCAVGLLLRNQR